MLIGATGRPAREHTLEGARLDGISQWLTARDVSVGIRPCGVATLDREERFAEDPHTESWLALLGRPTKLPTASDGKTGAGLASTLLAKLVAKGPDAIAEFEGGFAVVWYDARARQLHLMRDTLGVEPLYYAELGHGVLFGTSTREMVRTGLLPGGLCPQGFAEYVTYCFIPSDATLDRGVRQVPPGSRVVVDPDRGVVDRQRYYRISFAEPHMTDETEIAERFRGLLEDAVVRRMDDCRMGAFLSGGMDSSSVVTFLRKHTDEPIRTFSYRCAGRSFDESIYARSLADSMGTEHTEVEFGEPQPLEIDQAVQTMDMPICDVGLEIGSWLLAQAAGGNVDCIFTGDGGDEMWASHPVYAAERLMGWYEKLPIPGAATRWFQRLAANLPDSDQKRDLRVKLKRIFPAPGLPRELGPSRWRAYYAREDLPGILTPEMADAVRDCDPFEYVIRSYDGYDGPDDGLSPHIYSDYTALLVSYFQRLRLLRRFGIEARFPFYDRALVEFGAKIPARLKLEGIERTKRLFRAGMEGVLPDEINHRKDKLGHSIPFKNWLREEGPLARRVREVCSRESLASRGLFQPDAVARLFEEHAARRHNHSHRIWTIHVLELWLREREGAA